MAALALYSPMKFQAGICFVLDVTMTVTVIALDFLDDRYSESFR